MNALKIRNELKIYMEHIWNVFQGIVKEKRKCQFSWEPRQSKRWDFPAMTIKELHYRKEHPIFP